MPDLTENATVQAFPGMEQERSCADPGKGSGSPAPVEMFKAASHDGSGTSLRVDYLPASHAFEVSVSWERGGLRKEGFAAAFEPRFGMDAADMDRAYQVAEQLASAGPPPDGEGIL